jgi:hypothetical protein
MFQLALKAQERIEADRLAAEHALFVEEVKRRSTIRSEIASLEVDLGPDPHANDTITQEINAAGENIAKTSRPHKKVNLTLVEGDDITRKIQQFCQQYQVPSSYYTTLETALRKRIIHPPAYGLLLGAITGDGERRILGIPEGSNATVETGVFCNLYHFPVIADPLTTPWCEGLMKRVQSRLQPETYQRKILLVIPIDAPDGRKLQFVLREGEQHDLPQFVLDFLEYYKMPLESQMMLLQEILKRLPAIALQIPVGLSAQRQVTARFSMNENLTNVIEGFVHMFELDDNVKIALLKRARHGMAPGTFMV